MSRRKSGAEAKDSATLLNFAGASESSQIDAEQLLDEIDNLAVLLHEVKRQTDRIGAAADAIGDAILSRLDTGRTAAVSGSRTSRRIVPIQSKASGRLRTMPPRAEVTEVRSDLAK